MRQLVIVRPEPGASATAKAAQALGLTPVVVPLFEVRPLAWRPPETKAFDALLLTSANAVRCAGDGLARFRALPAYCVGEATAAEARAAAFVVKAIGTGGVEELLKSLPDGLKLLHLCGTHRREAASPRHRIEPLPVYVSAELPVGDRLSGIDSAVVALHSPRAAAVLARNIEAGRSQIALAAISAATAEAAGEGWERIAIALRPTDADLLAIAARLCNNPA
jgi:uroporphyrinogen-III synthase